MSSDFNTYFPPFYPGFPPLSEVDVDLSGTEFHLINEEVKQLGSVQAVPPERFAPFHANINEFLQAVDTINEEEWSLDGPLFQPSHARPLDLELSTRPWKKAKIELISTPLPQPLHDRDPVISKLAKKIFDAAQEKNWSVKELANKIQKTPKTLRKWIKNPERISFKNLYQLKAVAQELNSNLAKEIENLLPDPLYDLHALTQLKNKTSLPIHNLANKINVSLPLLMQYIASGTAIGMEYQYRLKNTFGNPPQDPVDQPIDQLEPKFNSTSTFEYNETISTLAKKIFEAALAKKWPFKKFANKVQKHQKILKRWITYPERVSAQDLYHLRSVAQELTPELVEKLESLLPQSSDDAPSLEQTPSIAKATPHTRHNPIISALAKKIFEAAQEKNWSVKKLAEKSQKTPRTLKKWIAHPEQVSLKYLNQLRSVAQELNSNLAEEINTLLPQSQAPSIEEITPYPRHDPIISALAKKIFEAAQEKNCSVKELAEKSHLSKTTLRKWIAHPEEIPFKTLYRFKEISRKLHPDLEKEIDNLLPTPLYDAKSIERLKIKKSLPSKTLARMIHVDHEILVNCQLYDAAINVEYQYRLKKLFGDPE